MDTKELSNRILLLEQTKIHQIEQGAEADIDTKQDGEDENKTPNKK